MWVILYLWDPYYYDFICHSYPILPKNVNSTTLHCVRYTIYSIHTMMCVYTCNMLHRTYRRVLVWREELWWWPFGLWRSIDWVLVKMHCFYFAAVWEQSLQTVLWAQFKEKCLFSVQNLIVFHCKIMLYSINNISSKIFTTTMCFK